jgi:hypothetical protein
MCVGRRRRPRGRRGVAKGRRQVRDDAGRASGPVGDDRVEPAAAGVAADHVGGAAPGGRGLVRARRRQARRRRHVPVRVDAQDPVELGGAVPASEQVDGAAEGCGRGVVQRSGESAGAAGARTVEQDETVGGGVGGGQAAGEQDPARGRRRRRVLERRGQRRRPPQDEDGRRGGALRADRPRASRVTARGRRRGRGVVSAVPDVDRVPGGQGDQEHHAECGEHPPHPGTLNEVE